MARIIERRGELYGIEDGFEIVLPSDVSAGDWRSTSFILRGSGSYGEVRYGEHSFLLMDRWGRHRVESWSRDSGRFDSR